MEMYAERQMELWEFGNVKIRKCGNVGMPVCGEACGSVKIRKWGNMEICVSRNFINDDD
jgi:hypothetical protein